MYSKISLLLIGLILSACTHKTTQPNYTVPPSTKNKILLAQDDERSIFYLLNSIKETEQNVRSVTVDIHQNDEKVVLIRQQEMIDCQRGLRTAIRATLFDNKNKIIESQDAEYPNYATWTKDEIADAVREQDDDSKLLIQKVCAVNLK